MAVDIVRREAVGPARRARDGRPGGGAAAGAAIEPPIPISPARRKSLDETSQLFRDAMAELCCREAATRSSSLHAAWIGGSSALPTTRRRSVIGDAYSGSTLERVISP